jgi:hypothetical protein
MSCRARHHHAIQQENLQRLSTDSLRKPKSSVADLCALMLHGMIAGQA